MIVHTPDLQVKDGILRLRVRVEYEKPAQKMPKALWFEMPAAQEQYLSARMDGWAACLFLVAMRRGEPFVLRGCISDHLAHGILEYQRVVSAWYPKEVRIVRLEAAGYDRSVQAAPDSVGLSFSGGVDSFFTLWSHISPQETSPAYQVTHAIFLEGVDIAHAEQATMRACRDAYAKLFDSLGMGFLTARTNIRDFFPEAEWGAWMGYPFLSGVGLLFGKLFRRFYVAAGETYWDFLYGGKRILLDQFFSTETFDLIHDGAGFARAEKIARIAHWEPVWDNLRVCYTMPNGLMNCCRCPKCLHAMVCFDLAGELKNVSTFPLGYTRGQFRTAPFDFSLLSVLNDTRRLSVAQGQRDITFDLNMVIALALTRGAVEKAYRRVARRLRRKKQRTI